MAGCGGVYLSSQHWDPEACGLPGIGGQPDLHNKTLPQKGKVGGRDTDGQTDRQTDMHGFSALISQPGVVALGFNPQEAEADT